MPQLAGVPKENLCGFGLLPFFLNWSASPKVPPSWILRTQMLPNRCEASGKGLRRRSPGWIPLSSRRSWRVTPRLKKFVRGHTFTCDRKHWYILSSQGAEDAAEQKNFSGQAGSRCAGPPGSIVPRTKQYGRPVGMAARGKVWNVHSLGTLLRGGRGSILADHGAHRRNLRGGVSRVARSLQSCAV